MAGASSPETDAAPRHSAATRSSYIAVKEPPVRPTSSHGTSPAPEAYRPADGGSRDAFATSTPPVSAEIPLSDDTDSLVARARNGDRHAFRALFERHRLHVARLVYRMTGPRAEIEDLIQDVFVQVHRSLRDFRGEARFSTWLHRVTVNVVLMHRRWERSRPVLAEEVAHGTVEDIETAGPYQELERRGRIEAFFALLDEISEKKRVVFILHDLEGMTPAEIAAIVEAPILTVRTRLFYARRELEDRMRAHPILGAIVDQTGGFAGESAREAPERTVNLSFSQVPFGVGLESAGAKRGDQ